MTYEPAADANGFATATVELQDNGTGSDSSGQQTFDINIAAVNDVPNFTVGSDHFFSGDSGPQIVSGWTAPMTSGPLDESGQTLNIIVSNDNPSLFNAQPTILADGTLT